MKLTNITLLSGIIFFLLIGCSGGEQETEAPDATGSEEVCTYTYNEGTSVLEWTSYKTTAKVPVAGSFNSIEVNSISSTDPVEVLKSISFKINTASVETNNEDRNGKIAEHFFGTNNTPFITGKVKELREDGTAVVEIMMNDINIDVEGEYTLEGAEFSFNSTIDVSTWNGIPGIDALNEICKDLHTGEDGVSKLWSEIGLSFTTKLKSDCTTVV